MSKFANDIEPTGVFMLELLRVDHTAHWIGPIDSEDEAYYTAHLIGNENKEYVDFIVHPA